MQKQVFRKDIGKEKEFNAESYNGSHTDIDEIIKFFTEAKKANATHVDWYAWSDTDNDGAYCQAQPFNYIQETDEEFNKRKNDEDYIIKRQLADNLKREKAEYEKLKLKFE